MLKKTRVESLLSGTRIEMRQSGIRARKKLGQHFLVDEAALDKIVAAAGLTSHDLVLEVGPGLGVLTKELVKNAGWVIAIELDNKMAAQLKDKLAALYNLTILNADILETDPAALLENIKTELPDSVDAAGYKVVANIPYYITSAVVRHFFEARIRPKLLILMVQKEIAEAITAAPGDMSLMAVSVQLFGKPEIVSHVPARSFFPIPKVDSAILKIEVYPKPIIDVEETSFFRLVRAGFTASRKQIPNSLSQGLRIPKAEVLPRLAKAGIEPQRRSESLSLEEWGRLWRVFQEENDHTASPGQA